MDERVAARSVREPAPAVWGIHQVCDGAEACLRYQVEGLQRSEPVRLTTADYQDDSDSLGDFGDEKFTVQAGSTVLTADLLATYKAWAHGE